MTLPLALERPNATFRNCRTKRSSWSRTMGLRGRGALPSIASVARLTLKPDGRGRWLVPGGSIIGRNWLRKTTAIRRERKCEVEHIVRQGTGQTQNSAHGAQANMRLATDIVGDCRWRGPISASRLEHQGRKAIAVSGRGKAGAERVAALTSRDLRAKIASASDLQNAEDIAYRSAVLPDHNRGVARSLVSVRRTVVRSRTGCCRSGPRAYAEMARAGPPSGRAPVLSTCPAPSWSDVNVIRSKNRKCRFSRRGNESGAVDRSSGFAQALDEGGFRAVQPSGKNRAGPNGRSEPVMPDPQTQHIPTAQGRASVAQQPYPSPTVHDDRGAFAKLPDQREELAPLMGRAEEASGRCPEGQVRYPLGICPRTGRENLYCCRQRKRACDR